MVCVTMVSLIKIARKGLHTAMGTPIQPSSEGSRQSTSQARKATRREIPLSMNMLAGGGQVAADRLRRKKVSATMPVAHNWRKLATYRKAAR